MIISKADAFVAEVHDRMPMLEERISSCGFPAMGELNC
jgi:hypothetical protein